MNRALNVGGTGNALQPLPGYEKAIRFIHRGLWLFCAALAPAAMLLSLLLPAPRQPLQLRPDSPPLTQPASPDPIQAPARTERRLARRMPAWHLAAQE